MPRRIKGHALTLEWSGEYGVEASSTGFCRCGWTESASSQREVRVEYRFHLYDVANRTQEPEPEGKDTRHEYEPDESGSCRICGRGRGDLQHKR